ncbi:MGMT family protein [Flavivirga amylovorans]|uniref:MGMT family protein n=1 Tax=Flavivirga amylovorans TaxID=870486 RepID=A0ABT8X5B7_9FLAO|nr:MGMT family protein [Flavivirga amylovorans]MDO5988750.1 MGMT family protein [Flavivirga amylovorans]
MIKPKIVDIPEKMEKFFGGKGKMLHPEISMIEALMRIIPLGRIATIDTLAKKMAKDFGVDVTCPMRTANGIKKITEMLSEEKSNNKIPYWRVVKKNREIINSKYVEVCASKLEDEGFKLSYPKSSGNIKVNFSTEELFTF